MRCPEVILPSTPNQLAFFRAMASSNALRGPRGLRPRDVWPKASMHAPILMVAATLLLF
jgi:hypothetical protein